MYCAACCAFSGSPKIAAIEHAGDRRLLDHRAIVARMQIAEHVADGARLVDQAAQVGAGALVAGIGLEHRLVEAADDQIVLHRAVVLEVLLGLAARHLVERRLGDEEMAAVDDLAHLAIEERQQQRADMGAVDVGVRHDDDLVIAQLVDAELVGRCRCRAR